MIANWMIIIIWCLHDHTSDGIIEKHSSLSI